MGAIGLERPICVKATASSTGLRCLANPDFMCGCYLNIPLIRSARLQRIYKEHGVTFPVNLLDEHLIDDVEFARQQLCEGRLPTILQRVAGYLALSR